jgi:HAD superfamily hydrolase (TIGR01549 family)
MDILDFIKNYEILIFDMGRTFMFEGDRFDDNQDYEKTYRSFGGKPLTNKKLHEIIYKIYGDLLIRSRNPDLQESMITVREYISISESFDKYPEKEKDLIAETFAHHECGVIPKECIETLQILSGSHRLGLISNVWCESHYYRKILEESGVHKLFECMVFSSDHSCVKPSKKIFNLAIDHFGKPPDEMVYTGDNYKRDVVGSKNAGMRSILVKNSDSSTIKGSIKPDIEISHICELL